MSPNPDDRYPSMAILLAQLRHDPRRAWRRFATVGILGAIGIVGVAVAQQPDAPEPCAVAVSRLQAATGATATAELRDAVRIDDAEAWNRVEVELASFSERWLAQHEAVCPSGVDAPLPGREHELDCMLEQVRDLETLRAILLEGPASDASRVADTIAALEPPQACATARPRPLVEDEAPARELLRQARIHDQLRHGDTARALADEAVDLTQTPAQQRLHAEALLRRGYAERTTGALPDAERDLIAAYFEGLRGGDEDTAAAAAVALVFHFADVANTTESDTWARHARSLIERGAGSAFARVNYHNAIGRLALERGDAPAAVDAFATALALMGRGDVAEAERGTLLLNLGMARARRGELEAAVRDLEAALAFNLDRYGEVYSGNITALLNLGTALDEIGEEQAALAAYERGLAVAEQVESPPAGTLATLLTSLAQLREELGDDAQTLQLLARARTSVEAAFGPSHPRMASILVAEGTALRSRGRFDEARQALTRALEIRRAAHGENDERFAIALANLAKVEGAAGHPEVGVPLAEEALRILELRLGPEHARVATARTILDELRAAISTSE
jgi:tetratricopeptide (TPR) repeat protein